MTMILWEELSIGPPWLWGLFMLALGASVGSFMNVVIYRLPAGLSIVSPGSHCPKCKSPVRGYDNIPVFSWLLLRGRCRDCGVSFSIRYAIVEALVGGLFLALFISEVLWGETTLPSRAVSLPLSLSPPLLFWGVYAFHLLLICTLLCASLIHLDGQRITWSLLAPAWVIGALAPLYLVTLRPLPLADVQAPLIWQAGALEGAVGFIVGAALGALSALGSIKQSPSRSDRRGEIWQASLVGLFLGWQAAAVIIGVAAFCFLLTALVGRARGSSPRFGLSVFLGGVTVLFLFAWKASIERASWLGDAAGLSTLVLAGVLVLTASLAGSALAPLPTSKTKKNRKR